MTKSKVNSNTTRHGRGFSVIELMITATVITIVTGFGVMGISHARANVRLSSAARQYASYIEKARIYSIRRHADTADQRATVAINDDRASYNVTMDLDGDGGTDTRTIPLPGGITFETIESISFDWRGRTWSTAGGVTTPNAQVSIRLKSTIDSISVDVTGSGDITIDSRVFDDAVPNVTLNVGDLAANATATPTPVSIATPDVTASPSPDVIADPTSTPTPNPDGTLPDTTPTPLPSPAATATATPTPKPTPNPAATATPTPSQPVCTITVDSESVIVGLEGSTTVKISHNGSSSISISGSSSKPSELQVTPGGSQSVGAGGSATFTIKSKKSPGVYSLTFTSNCGSTTIPVVVAAL